MNFVIDQLTRQLQALLASSPMEFSDQLRSELPSEPGVYQFFEVGSDWQTSIYVGQGSDLQRRIYQNHFKGGRRVSTLKRKLIDSGCFENEDTVKSYFTSHCLVQYIPIPDAAERTWFEHFAIAVLRPEYND